MGTSFEIVETVLSTSSSTYDINLGTSDGDYKGALCFMSAATAWDTVIDNSLMAVAFTDFTNNAGGSTISLDNQATTSGGKNQGGTDARVYNIDKTTVNYRIAFTQGTPSKITITFTANPGDAYRFWAVVIKGAKNVTVGSTLMDQAQNATKDTTVGHPTSALLCFTQWVGNVIGNNSTAYSNITFGYADSARNSGCISLYDDSGVADTDVHTALYNNSILNGVNNVYYYEYTGNDATTFTFTKRGGTNAFGVFWMAIETQADEYTKVLDFNSPASTGNSSVTGITGTPFGALLTATCCAAMNTDYDTDVDSNGSFGHSFFTSSKQYASSICTRDDLAASDTKSVSSNTKALYTLKKGSTTDSNIASYASMDNGGFTLNWSTLNTAGSKNQALVFSKIVDVPVVRRPVCNIVNLF